MFTSKCSIRVTTVVQVFYLVTNMTISCQYPIKKKTLGKKTLSSAQQGVKGVLTLITVFVPLAAQGAYQSHFSWALIKTLIS